MRRHQAEDTIERVRISPEPGGQILDGHRRLADLVGYPELGDEVQAG
jgi:hypothetical protein